MSFTYTASTFDGTVTAMCTGCLETRGFRSEVWRQAWERTHKCQEAAA